jgi:hypothetical protein
MSNYPVILMERPRKPSKKPSWDGLWPYRNSNILLRLTCLCLFMFVSKRTDGKGFQCSSHLPSICYIYVSIQKPIVVYLYKLCISSWSVCVNCFVFIWLHDRVVDFGSQQGQEFSLLPIVQAAHGTHPADHLLDHVGPLLQRYRGRRLKLTTQLQLVLRSRKHGYILVNPLTHTSSWCTA